MALGPSAVADGEDGADGSSRLSLRAMVSAYGCSKGIGNWSQRHTVASLKVPLPVAISAEAWVAVSGAQQYHPGAASKVPVFLYCSSGCEIWAIRAHSLELIH